MKRLITSGLSSVVERVRWRTVISGQSCLRSAKLDFLIGNGIYVLYVTYLAISMLRQQTQLDTNESSHECWEAFRILWNNTLHSSNVAAVKGFVFECRKVVVQIVERLVQVLRTLRQTWCQHAQLVLKTCFVACTSIGYREMNFQRHVLCTHSPLESEHLQTQCQFCTRRENTSAVTVCTRSN